MTKTKEFLEVEGLIKTIKSKDFKIDNEENGIFLKGSVDCHKKSC